MATQNTPSFEQCNCRDSECFCCRWDLPHWTHGFQIRLHLFSVRASLTSVFCFILIDIKLSRIEILGTEISLVSCCLQQWEMRNQIATGKQSCLLIMIELELRILFVQSMIFGVTSIKLWNSPILFICFSTAAYI